MASRSYRQTAQLNRKSACDDIHCEQVLVTEQTGINKMVLEGCIQTLCILFDPSDLEFANPCMFWIIRKMCQELRH